MPSILSQQPEKLQPYLFHGLDLTWQEGDKNASCDCPWCGKEGHFGVEIETGLWKCLVCAEGSAKGGGNVYTFIRKLWELSDQSTTTYSELSEERRLLFPDTLTRWGICRSALTCDWLVPGYGADGKLRQLYRYIMVNGKGRLLPTPTLGHQLHGTVDPTKSVVYVCEGPWDAMALEEVMRQTKATDRGFKSTASPTRNLLADASVVAVPGCSTFLEPWIGLMSGKVVRLLYDSDHPKKNAKTGQAIAPAGSHNMMRVAGLLNSSSSPPESVEYLRWGEQGYDPSLPSGHDVRDCLSEGENLDARVGLLEGLLNRLTPAPADAVDGVAKKKGKGKKGEMECVKCSGYKELALAWRKALKWTDGLDHALCSMLACVASTKLIGDQLWIKVISPAACLHGSTPIYDPINKTTVSVYDRWKAGQKFWVYTRKGSRLGISQAMPPRQFPRESMYEVTFKSGKCMKVTGGHRFWNGSSYVPLHVVSEALQIAVSSYPLPTISGTALLAREQDARHWKKTAQDYQSCCSAYFCLCGEQLHQEVDACQYASPLLSGVQEYTSGIAVSVDDLLGTSQKCTPHCFLQNVPPSNFHSSQETCLGLSQKGVIEYLALQDICKQHCSQSVVEQHNHALKPRKGRGQQDAEYDQSSNVVSSEIQSQLQLCFETLSRLRHETLACTPEQSGSDNTRQWQTFYLQQLAVLQQSVALSPFALEPVEWDVGQCGDSFESQRMNFQKDTYQQLAEVGLEKLDACLTSVKVDHRQLGTSILPVFDGVVKVEYVGEENYYDFHVPETKNYWAEGFFHHNSGKSTLAEAISVSKKHVTAKSTIRGFHSGFSDEGSEGEDNSLISKLYDRTLVIKDGDTLLTSPNLPQILSEARDIYDGVSRTSYRNKMSKDYEGIRLTIILCGTSSLRAIDSSELGERFLDVVIMEGIDDEMEDEVLARVAHRADRNLSLESNGEAVSRYEPELATAMGLTGGYVEYLRQNAADLIAGIDFPTDAKHLCTRLGKFTAHMRARPSKHQEENAEREFASRLVSQLIRMSKCLALVLNKSIVDEEVMARVRRVALDTSRGQTLDIVRRLHEEVGGLESRTIAVYNSRTDEETKRMLRFLKMIGVVEVFVPEQKGVKGRQRWRMTGRMKRLYKDTMGVQED